jgi:hypothetical protein
MKNQIQTIEITDEICEAIQTAIKPAIEYEKLTGRKLGITGEVGEVLVCCKLKELGLAKLELLADPINAGYDAVDEKKLCYQIKTRRIIKNNHSGVTGSFAEHDFKFAILAILNKEYKISELYQTDNKRLQKILEKRPRRNPTIRQFIAVADCICKIKNA